jgi:zinc transport system permease protein
MGIIENYEFWRDSVLALIIASISLSYLGVWASLKKVVYQPLAISQVSSLGVILIFFINEKFKLSIASEIGAFTLALLMSFYFSSRKSRAREAEVYLYIFASALVFLFGNFIRKDLHDVQSILFGDSVLVDFKQIIYLLIVSIIILIIYVIFYKKFLYISFDPDSSTASGFRAYKYNVMIYMSFAIIISISSNTI